MRPGRKSTHEHGHQHGHEHAHQPIDQHVHQHVNQHDHQGHQHVQHQHDHHHDKHTEYHCHHKPEHDLAKWHEAYLCKLIRNRYETNIDYKIDPIFDFNKYKTYISQMLTDYFEDIITAEDKIKF